MSDNEMTGANSPASAQPGHREWPYRRSLAKRYGVAVCAVLVAALVRYAIYGDATNRAVFTFFVPAAMVAAWYGGLGPGIVATVLGVLVGDFFFFEPRFALWPLSMRVILAICVYLVTTVMCVVLCEKLHNRIRHFEYALEHERHHDHLALPVVTQEFADFLTRYYLLATSRNYAYSSWPYRRSFALRYGLAAGMVIAAFALRYWMFGTQEYRFPFIFFVPAAMVATWYGGMVPGLLATVAGLLLGDYFFLSDHEALGIVQERERVAIGLYAVTTTLCVMLFENLHERIRRLEHAFDRARHHTHPHAAAPAPGGAPGASAAH